MALATSRVSQKCMRARVCHPTRFVLLVHKAKFSAAVCVHTYTFFFQIKRFDFIKRVSLDNDQIKSQRCFPTSHITQSIVIFILKRNPCIHVFKKNRIAIDTTYTFMFFSFSFFFASR